MTRSSRLSAHSYLKKRSPCQMNRKLRGHAGYGLFAGYALEFPHWGEDAVGSIGTLPVLGGLNLAERSAHPS